jgi:hypothetical protein
MLTVMTNPEHIRYGHPPWSRVRMPHRVTGCADRYSINADRIIIIIIISLLTLLPHGSYEVIPPGWEVESVLTNIAQQPFDQRYSALIDTGALITGLSNIEVRRVGSCW